MIRLYRCECCGKAKEWCEMNSRTICKNCWIKEYNKKFTDAGMKMIRTKRLKEKTREILEL